MLYISYKREKVHITNFWKKKTNNVTHYDIHETQSYMYDEELGTEELKSNLHSCKIPLSLVFNWRKKMKRDMKDDNSNTSS